MIKGNEGYGKISEPKPPKIKIPFKQLKIGGAKYRAKVFGGWIVEKTSSMVFIPDPHHQWEIE